MGTAHTFERGQQLLAGDAIGGEQLAGRGALLFGEREQQVLSRDVRIAERLRISVGAVENARKLTRERRIGPARLLGKAIDFALGLGQELRDVEARFLEQRHDNAFLLLEESVEQMGIVDDGIAFGARHSSGLLESFGRLYG